MILGARGVLLCCMARSASGVYHFTAEELRQVCLETGLDYSGAVIVLRQRLVDHVKRNAIASTGGNNDIEASVATYSIP